MPSNPIEYKALNQALASRLAGYDKEIQSLFYKAMKELSLLTALANHNPSVPFTFDKIPSVARKRDEIIKDLVTNIQTRIQYNEKKEWDNANQVNDKLVRNVMSKTRLTEEQLKKFMPSNYGALMAFQNRKEAGMFLSDRVWNTAGQFQFEMENAIDMALMDGRSAAELSRDVRKHLKEPDKLFRRVRDARGQLHLSKRAKAYNQKTGLPVGVYRSSYKNAMRLARTEITMAYRTADHERWQDMDFVVGFEVHLSGSHKVPDICDHAKGKYPKDFKFIGWHPQCLCYKTSILATDTEIAQMEENILKGTGGKVPSANEITDVPKGFKDWIKANEDRSKGWKSQPYFVKDNFKNGKLVDGLSINTVKGIKQAIKPTFVDILPDGFDTRRMQLSSDDIVAERRRKAYELGEDMGLRFDKENLTVDDVFELLGGRAKANEFMNNILEDSNVYMAINGSTLRGHILKEGGMFKNSLETGKGTFKTVGEARAVKERLIFGIGEDVVDADQFPKYGFVSTAKEMTFEDITGWGYGDVYVKFKKANVFDRTSITFGDSYDGNMLMMGNKGLEAGRIAPPTRLNSPDENFLLSLKNRNKEYTKDFDYIYKCKNVDDLARKSGTYIEAQIYGKVNVADIESLTVSSIKEAEALNKAIKKAGLDIDVVPAKYDKRMKYIWEASDYGGEGSKYLHSLNARDIDNLSDAYIEKLADRFMNVSKNWFDNMSDWKLPDKLTDGVISFTNGWIKDGKVTDKTLKFLTSKGRATTTDKGFKFIRKELTIADKREWLKEWYSLISKKEASGLPKVWWEDFRPAYGGFTDDIFNKNLLKSYE